jgi:fatty-acyl-CoA synthase
MPAYSFPLLIKHLLLTPLAQVSRQQIVYRDLIRYDYSTFRERIGRLGSALTRLGVKPGNTVAVMDWDSHRYLECFFGIPMLGAVLQTVNVRLSPEQVAYTLNHAEADVVLCHSDFLPMLQAIRGHLQSVKKFVCLTDTGAAPTGFDWHGEYEALLAGGDPEHDFPDFDENTQATTFYTSGTTGLPKGVFFSHRQLVLHTLATLATMALGGVNGRISREDVYMPLTPMFHVHAWGFPYVATVAGMKQVYPGRYQPEVLLELFVREKVTLSHCVPTLIQMLLSAPAAKAVDLRGWKVAIGGSALPKALCKAALDRGIDIFTGYGMSETGPTLTVAQLKKELIDSHEAEVNLRTTAGMPVPLVDLKIVDQHMHELPRDGITAGEIVARAPWLTQGYFKNPEASAALWEGGYLHTGDIGTIDPNGYLHITDRIKDVIKTGGEWVSSLDLEDVISQHPAVLEVAVIGVKDEKWGERPMALVVLRAGFKVDVATLQAHVLAFAQRGAISKYAVPERIRFVESLDKTSVGKLDKKVLRQKFGT